MAKSNAPRTFFPIFFGGAAGRLLVDDLWPLAAMCGKEKPPKSVSFCRYEPISGGSCAEFAVD